MSLSSNLWTGTGLFHCLVGLAVPEVRDPLMRIVREGTVDATNLEERYARGNAVWFHFFGLLVVLQGVAWKHYVRETKKELPTWWGWSVTAMGLAMGKIMPASGWSLVMGQGVRIVWRNRRSNGNNNDKNIEGKKEE